MIVGCLPPAAYKVSRGGCGVENMEIYTPHHLDASQEYSSHQERTRWELIRIWISDQNPHIS